MIAVWNWFVKITGWPAQFFCFRTKVYYEDRAVQTRRIHGPAILMSNHTSVFDYAVYLFVFYSRTLRFQMAEVLFRKPVLGRFLKMMGGIYVDRDGRDFGFIERSRRVLEKGGVVGVFPESRLPRPEEERPLPFKVSLAYLALSAGVPIIPVVTDGSYFRRRRARVLIGKPLDAADLTDPALDERANLQLVSDRLRDHTIALEKLLHERTKA